VADYWSLQSRWATWDEMVETGLGPPAKGSALMGVSTSATCVRTRVYQPNYSGAARFAVGTRGLQALGVSNEVLDQYDLRYPGKQGVKLKSQLKLH
jgi:hypothetical protein